MDWQEVKDRPLGYPWQTGEVCQCFEAVRGGVAWPGKNPGFAVVAGLRRIWDENSHVKHCLLVFDDNLPSASQEIAIQSRGNFGATKSANEANDSSFRAVHL